MLAAYGLPTSLCDEDGSWFAFLTAYAGVIEDGSLTCKGNSKRLKKVKRVVFTKGPQKIADSHVPFGIQWTIVLKDENRIEVDVNAPVDGKSISWGSSFCKQITFVSPI